MIHAQIFHFLCFSDANNRIGVLFFSVTTPVFSSAAAIPVVQSRRLLLGRERSSQMYFASLHYLAEYVFQRSIFVSVCLV